MITLELCTVSKFNDHSVHLLYLLTDTDMKTEIFTVTVAALLFGAFALLGLSTMVITAVYVKKRKLFRRSINEIQTTHNRDTLR